MRATATRAVTAFFASGLLATGCSDPAPRPTGAVSKANAGKASFSESKAIEKIYRAGFTGISSMRRDADGAWRGQAIRKGSETMVTVSVVEDGTVVAR